MSFNRFLGLAVLLIGTAGLIMGDYLYFLVIPSLLLGNNLNRIVCLANGGTMPVFSKRKSVIKRIPESNRHHLGTKQTKLMFLADIIDTRIFGVFSIGDILIFGSLFASGKYVYNLTTAIL